MACLPDRHWRRVEVPFERVSHLKNRWNKESPVQTSADGQELPPELGEALRALLDAAGKEKPSDASAASTGMSVSV